MYILKLLAIQFLLISGFGRGDDPEPIRWVIAGGCSLKVQGSTNINQFTCVIANISKPDTLSVYRAAGSGLARMNGVLKLDLKGFDCFNPMMTADLRKTLKAKEYPFMVIRFINLSRLPDPGQNMTRMHGWVSIEMAGVTKKFDVSYLMSNAGADRIILKGTRDINFSDFNIIPPRKIGGMIQTNDKLTAEFNLVLKVLK